MSCIGTITGVIAEQHATSRRRNDYSAISQLRYTYRQSESGPFHGGSLDVGERAWHQYLRTGLKIDAPQARFFWNCPMF